MRAALALAARGLGECWPNPSVGCVLVRDGRVIGRGRTAPGGRPHAETQALAVAADARGATAYVSLEPCSHHGRTPPCCDALIAAGVARVVIGLRDPDPRVDGTGMARLRAAGLAVQTGVLEAEAADIAEGFVRRIRDHRPMVTLKLATTLDGRIATCTAASQWITGPAARRAAHALRAEHDAILVGTGTVAADDPSLTCRIAGARTIPLVRIVADSKARIPCAAALLAGLPAHPLWLLTDPDPDPDRLAALHHRGAETIPIHAAEAGIDIAAALRALAARGITRLLAEGGARIVASLLGADLVDRIAWFHAPGIIGGDGLPAAAAFGTETLAQMKRFARVDSRPVGADMLTTLRRIS